MGQAHTKDVWRFSTTALGALCVTTSGAEEMHWWCVVNWGIQGSYIHTVMHILEKGVVQFGLTTCYVLAMRTTSHSVRVVMSTVITVKMPE